MQTTTVQIAPENVRAFVQEYFDAWKGTDENKILSYYSDDIVIDLPAGKLDGKTAVRDNFVRPFISAFPGNVHAIRNLAHVSNLVAMEWNFQAVHKGRFANVEATGKQVQVPGCSFYEYDLGARIPMKMSLLFAVSMTLALITAAACFAQNYAQANLVSSPATAASATEPQLDSPRSTTEIHARIRSTPSGAGIFVDGTYVGTTPLDIGLTCCFHDVSISKSGFKRWTGRIRNNGHPNINVHLQK